MQCIRIRILRIIGIECFAWEAVPRSSWIALAGLLRFNLHRRGNLFSLLWWNVLLSRVESAFAILSFVFLKWNISESVLYTKVCVSVTCSGAPSSCLLQHVPYLCGYIALTKILSFIAWHSRDSLCGISYWFCNGTNAQVMLCSQCDCVWFLSGSSVFDDDQFLAGLF